MHHGREPPPWEQREGDPVRGSRPREQDPRNHRDNEHSRRGHQGHREPDHRQGYRDHGGNRGHDRRPSHDRNNGPPPQNGPPPDRSRNGPPHPGQHDKRPPPNPQHFAPLSHPPPAKYSSYKLIIDPFIHKDVKEKVVRYDGEIPGDQHSITPTPVDPRKKHLNLWKLEKIEPLDLPVPRFIIDSNYVGEPPKVEVTFDNLNDNIDKQFLAKTIQKFGECETIHIEYHPVTNKHLGMNMQNFLLVCLTRI